jgi:bacteriocin biosynthesis cyclodehydratase domain-containing protein
METRRPRLAYPFTVLAEPGAVRLVAGEDYRYTLTGSGLERWLPDLLARLNGSTTLGALLADLPAEQRDAARALLERLYGERVLVDGTASEAHAPRPCLCVAAGQGALFDHVRETQTPDGEGACVRVLCQDRLDFGEALAGQREARRAGAPFLWASTGAMNRGYVSPVFLPDAGPCFGCLLGAFRRLSPAPELYDALLAHGEQRGAFTPAPFPDEGVAVLGALVAWKLGQLERGEPPAALYRLHVLELETMEVSVERVFLDLECPVCAGGRQ